MVHVIFPVTTLLYPLPPFIPFTYLLACISSIHPFVPLHIFFPPWTFGLIAPLSVPSSSRYLLPLASPTPLFKSMEERGDKERKRHCKDRAALVKTPQVRYS
ncbi:MAG: hypothetical protein JOS17DRAFT_91144 [Linnemannia elongata]|nr:MAG: hypothetical protein JOS17DRAFT_91144 [Linnemannia elongata]